MDIIIAEQGCVVPDLLLRSGRRGAEVYEKRKGGGNCVNKPISKQRIDTLRFKPVHPDCIEAYIIDS